MLEPNQSLPTDWQEHDMKVSDGNAQCRRCGLSWYPGIATIGKCRSVPDSADGWELPAPQAARPGRALLEQVQAVLRWGCEEMKGRPPQHWIDACAAVEAALAGAGQTQAPPVANQHKPVWDAVIEDAVRWPAADLQCQPEDDYIETLVLVRSLAARLGRDIVADMKARDMVGRKRYGMPLQPFNGHNALLDAYEELLDAAVYQKQHLIEQGLS